VPASDPNGGFNIFGFIDNNILSTSRRGGGPLRDGRGVERKDILFKKRFTLNGRRLMV
jgi:hypothetical protein